jgi:Uridine phosphorylase
MNPVHIKAKRGEIAEKVIIAGDPARVELLSKMLDNPKLVNKNRGILIYTGERDGEMITVATHGVGGPYIAIVLEELIMLGAKAIVRIGTTGAMIKEMKIGELVIPTGASYYLGGTIGQYFGRDASIVAVPDYDLLSLLVENTRKRRVKHYIGTIITSDAFYAEDPEFVTKWTSRGAIAVEMECSTLFTLGSFRKVKTGAILIISDNLIEAPEKYASAEELESYAKVAGEIVLESLHKLKV